MLIITELRYFELSGRETKTSSKMLELEITDKWVTGKSKENGFESEIMRNLRSWFEKTEFELTASSLYGNSK